MTRRGKPKPDIVGQMLTGTIECLFAFGVILSNRGLITRKELADEFGFHLQQLQQRSAEIAASQAEFTARAAPATVLKEMFSRPVSSGPIVIEGGKAISSEDDPPPSTA